jgi:hypothetical protein
MDHVNIRKRIGINSEAGKNGFIFCDSALKQYFVMM